MDNLELLFGIEIAGAEKLATLVTSTRAVGDTAKTSAGGVNALDAAIKTLQGVADGGAASLGRLSSANAGVTSSTQQTAAAMDKEVASATAAAAAVDKLATSHRRAVTDVQAAGAAIRGLEGSLNVRAVEQFATKFLGLGSIAQSLFPIFGATAFIEIIGRGIEKLGEMYNAWNPVLRAEQKALDKLKEHSSELDRIDKKLQGISDKEYERQFGKGALDLRQAAFAKADEKIAQGNIDRTLAKIAELEGKIKAGITPEHYILGPEGYQRKIPSSLTPDAAAAKATIQGLTIDGGELDLYRRQLALAKAEGQDKLDDKKKRDSEEGLRQYNEVAGILNRVKGEHAQAYFSTLAPIQKIQQQGEYSSDNTLNELRGAGAGSGQIAEAKQKLDDIVRIKVEEELAKLVGSWKGGIAGAPSARSGQFAGDQWQFQGYRERKPFDLDSLKSDEFLGLRSRELSKGLGKSIADDGKSISSDKSAFDAYIREEQKQAEAQGNRALKLAQLNAGPGGEGRAAEESYRIRLDLAEKLFNITARKIALEVTAADQNKALAEARIRADDERFQAEQEHILRLAELQRKSLDEARAQAGKLFDAFTSKNPSQALRDFGINEVKGLGRQVFQNVAGGPIQSATSSLASIFPAGGAIGNALKGTILDPTKNGDPQKITADNTGKILKQAEKTNDLLSGQRTTDGATFLGDSGGGAGGGLPSIGLPTGAMSPELGKVLFGSALSGDFLTPRGGASLLKQFGGDFGTGLGAFASGGGANLWGAITGNQQQLNKDGTWSDVSGATRTGEIAGAAAAAIPAAIGIYSGIKKGGVGGFSSAAASGLGLAAAFDLEPISKAVLGIAALGASIIGSVFGQNPEKRDAQITKYLNQSQYLAPTSQSATFDIATGKYLDYGRDGQVRTSSLSPYSQVVQPTVNRFDGGFFNVPGTTTSPGGVTLNVYQTNHNSLVDAAGVNNLGPMMADSLRRAIRGGQAGGLTAEIKGQLLPG